MLNPQSKLNPKLSANMIIKILKILYWLMNVTILYVYFGHNEKIVALPIRQLATFAFGWVLLSIIYGYGLATYLATKGKKGNCM